MNNALLNEIINKLSDCKSTILEDGKNTISGEDLASYIKAYSTYLRKNGVSQKDSVGVVMHNSIECFISYFGAWRCCDKVVCINPNYSNEDVDNVLNDLNADFYISKIQRKNTKKHILPFDQAINLENQDSISLGNGNLFLLTSGTTSVAKLIPFNNEGFNGFCQLYEEIFNECSISKMLMFCPLYFSLGIATLLMAMRLGISIYIASELQKRIPTVLFNEIEKRGVDFCVLPTSYMKLIDGVEGTINKLPTAVKIITIVGEQAVLSKRTTDFLLDNKIRLYNQYGATETLCLFSYMLNKNDCNEEKNILPIGKPLNNVRAKLGEDNQAKGILYISFSADSPVGKKDSWYCTDDLCEIRNGNYYIVGRNGNCIKINGNRVELDFVESTLLKLTEIKDACVISCEEDSRTYLVAYIIEKETIDDVQLYTKLTSYLPEYMMPRKFIRETEIIKNGSGKTDRNKMREKYYAK